MSTAIAHTRTPVRTDWQRRYEVLRELGRGGFAVVYEAFDRDLERGVALKVIEEGRGLSERVLREVEAAAALAHPNIVTLYDYFGDGQRSVLVWELVRGESLAALRGELSDADAVGAMVQVLDAIAHAHAQGVVHRDIKPQNILLDEEGRAKVMDFGIARLSDTDTLTAEGDLLGTVAYMSPEQAAGRRVGPASDVYSTAIVLFELLANVNPVRGATVAETISNVVGGRALTLQEARRDLPAELHDLIAAAMSPTPAARPSAAGLAASLRRLLATEQLKRGWRSWSFPRRLTWFGWLAERCGGAALGGVAVAKTLDALPAYPPSWTLLLATMAAVIWAVVPGAGLAFLLGAFVFPMFNVSVSVGIAYVLAALIVLFVCRARPVSAVWPVLGLVLMPVYGVLIAPAAAAVLGRVRGPVTAAWAAVVTYVYLTLAGQADSAFAGFQSASGLSHRVAVASNPVSVAVSIGSAAFGPVSLAQAIAWAGLAGAVWFARSLRKPELRLWVWAVAFSAIFAIGGLAPAAIGRAAGVGTLLWSVAVGAVVVVLPLLSRTNPGLCGRRLWEGRSVQEDGTQA